MNEYENSQYGAILEWKKKEPGVVTKAFGYALKPVSWLMTLIVPQKAIEGCLVAFDKIAEFFTDTDDVLRDGSVNNLEELQSKSLQMSDKLAKSVHNWALAIAGVEGGTTGVFGLGGLVVDIPALITMSLRVIHKIGVCYGFEVRTEEDRNFVYGVLSAASANTIQEKTVVVLLLRQLNVLVAKTAWKQIAKVAATQKTGIAALVITIKHLAKQLGINITKRKAAQAIPVVGAAVGAAVNVAYLDDVAWAARRMYQERWLMINKRINLE